MLNTQLFAIFLFALAVVTFYLFLFPLIWGAGYSPTRRKQLMAAATLLQLKEGDTVYDLGSGFGGAVTFFAEQCHVSARGVEIDPLRCYMARWGIRRHGISDRVTIIRGNLLDADLRDSSKVFFFLTPLLMRRLQEKVAREMPEGGRVVSVEHRFPEWRPTESVENVHLYIVPRREGASGS